MLVFFVSRIYLCCSDLFFQCGFLFVMVNQQNMQDSEENVKEYVEIEVCGEFFVVLRCIVFLKDLGCCYVFGSLENECQGKGS